MSSKRPASSDLNHDNWADEEEPEERGEFRTAPEEELNKRVIKRARRRITGTSDNTEVDSSATAASSATQNIFSKFKGFGSNTTNPLSSTNTAGAFSFLAKIPTVATAAATADNTATKTTTPTFSFGQPATPALPPQSNFSFGNPAPPIPASTTLAATPLSAFAVKKNDEKPSPKLFPTPDKTSISALQKSVNYCAKLKVLNENIRDWIKTNVDKNPICLLTPIFKEYEQYLSELEKEDKSPAETENTNKAEDSVKTNTTDASPKTTPPKITFGATTGSSAGKNFTSGGSLFGNLGSSTTTTDNKTNGFSFAQKSASEQAASNDSNKTTGFNFGFSKPPEAPAVPTDAGAGDEKKVGFSFTANATPFTFGNIKPLAADADKDKAEDNEEEEELPKEEIKQVVEEDAVYSKKCKVFVKHDDTYGDRGVGTLYLKPVQDSNKTQLIVRADTNLGNILLNFILNDTIPTKRTGKNNVLLVCVPTPDDKKPTPVLVRVKTGEEADDLLETIDKHKK